MKRLHRQAKELLKCKRIYLLPLISVDNRPILCYICLNLTTQFTYSPNTNCL